MTFIASTGPCPHGVVDASCPMCLYKRGATDRQQPPTGEGEIVLDRVKQFLELAIQRYSLQTALGPLVDPGHLALLLVDLICRSNAGEKKYGTPLRVHNGRSAILDLYQEVQDAIMYSMQAKMEGDKQGGAYFEILYQIGSQIAGELNKRG